MKQFEDFNLEDIENENMDIFTNQLELFEAQDDINTDESLFCR